MGTASEVTSRDVAPRIRALPTLPVDILACPGVTLWGPINTATIVVDYDDFFERFRGFQLNYETALQVRQFFLGGGRKAVINRVVHVNPSTGVPVSAAKATSMAETAAGAPTKGAVLGTVVGPFALVAGDTLICDTDGVGDQTLAFTAVQATITSGAAEFYALADAMTLTLKIDGGAVQPIIFNTGEFVAIGAATALEVAAVINAEAIGLQADGSTGSVIITSDKAGSDSIVEITGGTANVALAFGVVPVTGSGNVADISAVTVAELIALCDATFTNGGGVTSSDVAGKLQIEANTAGAAGSVAINATSTADDELGLDNATHSGTTGAAQNTLKVDGKYEGGTVGNALTYDIGNAQNGEAERWDMVEYLSGAREKVHRNLTMDSADPLYAVTILGAESLLLAGIDQSATGTVLQRRPANVTGVALSGGDDGLALLDDNDFIGQQAFNTGLYAFDLLTDGDVLICPDRPTAAVANAASSFCETNKKRTMTFIPDIPAGQDSDDIVTFLETLSPSEQTQAVPWPRIKIPNPDKAIFGTSAIIVVATSGSIAGRMARNTKLYETHVATQPGNEIYGRLENVVDVESDEVKDINKRRKVTPAGVNPILAGKDTNGTYGVWLNDVQALDRTQNFKSIGENRLMSLIRKTVNQYLETIRTTPNTQRNRLKDKQVVEAYLLQWCTRGALASKDASEAFYVNTDPKGTGINNPLVQEREEYKMVVAVATARARRFVEVLFTRDNRAVENYIQQQLTSP